jgi:hypothetical protein
MSDDFVNLIQTVGKRVVHEIKHLVVADLIVDVLSDLEFPSYVGLWRLSLKGPRPVVPMNLSLWPSSSGMVMKVRPKGRKHQTQPSFP